MYAVTLIQLNTLRECTIVGILPVMTKFLRLIENVHVKWRGQNNIGKTS